eukprot:CAMPEP_0174236626 /NCGR_PEP_ID=MMETSP0417-20130205/5700_1 /TAXON_ID=242541 /ORGANISM="Mayorella sp, Strain BSH-02190019" /LENGTH=548 /DNA_ID=CAMNT_0015315297 /DNA_START=70 /DNA_END=1712 /DNA_ORIENTATION=+
MSLSVELDEFTTGEPEDTSQLLSSDPVATSPSDEESSARHNVVPIVMRDEPSGVCGVASRHVWWLGALLVLAGLAAGVGLVMAFSGSFGSFGNHSSTPVVSPEEESAHALATLALQQATEMWTRLAFFTDHFPARLGGTDNLREAARWIVQRMQEDGRLESPRLQPVSGVPHWLRAASDISPPDWAVARFASRALPDHQRTAPNATTRAVPTLQRTIQVVSLGGSIGTPEQGISAPVLVVGSEEELKSRAAEARGRIVLFDVPFTSYGVTVRYRTKGAVYAARVGAIASLVRSVTPRSLGTPHTGLMEYEEGVERIPHGAITTEDSAWLRRLSEAGTAVDLSLYMHCASAALPADAFNVLAELRGAELPDEVVVIGGHLDSWDLATGAYDDGGGLMAAWCALELLAQLDVPLRRTVRMVAWADEEQGGSGAEEYARAAFADGAQQRHVFAVESDNGVMTPTGLGYSSSDGGPLNATLAAALSRAEQLVRTALQLSHFSVSQGGGGADVTPLLRQGVPVGGLHVDSEHYFDYHHSAADTVDKVIPEELA